jgi:hypothetical protein
VNSSERLKKYGAPKLVSGFHFVMIHHLPAGSGEEQVCDLYWARQERFIFVGVHYAPSYAALVSYHYAPGNDPCDSFYVRTPTRIEAMSSLVRILRNLDREISSVPEYLKKQSEEAIVVSHVDFGHEN